jgi:hypothetical protein
LLTYCQEHFPDSYAGLVVLDRTRQIVVYRRPSAAMDAAVQRRFPEAPVVFHDARHSERELKGLAERIAGDSEYWRKLGVKLDSVGPRADGSAVEVATHEVARARQLFLERYGQAPVVIVYGQGQAVLVPPQVGPPVHVSPPQSAPPTTG